MPTRSFAPEARGAEVVQASLGDTVREERDNALRLCFAQEPTEVHDLDRVVHRHDDRDAST
jgi:hypothetical protein